MEAAKANWDNRSGKCICNEGEDDEPPHLELVVDVGCTGTLGDGESLPIFVNTWSRGSALDMASHGSFTDSYRSKSDAYNRRRSIHST